MEMQIITHQELPPRKSLIFKFIYARFLRLFNVKKNFTFFIFLIYFFLFPFTSLLVWLDLRSLDENHDGHENEIIIFVFTAGLF